MKIDPPSVKVASFIQVRLAAPDDFLKVRETLTRVGRSSVPKKTLWQACHILHKRGNYYIVHFKEMLGLDGKQIILTEEDVAWRNTIANMLATWGLVELVDPPKSAFPTVPISKITVLPFKEKARWRMESKYTVGRKVKQRGPLHDFDDFTAI